MMNMLKHLLFSEGFMPHGFCYLWNPKLILLHVLSDGLIFAAYQSIPFTLIYFARRRRDMPFRWIFWYLGAVFVLCGLTHGMEIWTLWHADYWLSGSIKAVTAIASVSMAILLLKMAPQAIAFTSAAAVTPVPTTGRSGRSALGGDRPLWLAYGVGALRESCREIPGYFSRGSRFRTPTEPFARAWKDEAKCVRDGLRRVMSCFANRFYGSIQKHGLGLECRKCKVEDRTGSL